MKVNNIIGSPLIYSVFIIIIFLLFAFNTYLYLKQPDLIFYPTKDVDVTPKEWQLDYHAVDIKLANKRNITGWYLPHPEAEKTVLFFHGNGGNVSHRGNSLYIFHKLKLNVLIIDYLGYGKSGGEPSEEGLYQSANAAWQYLLNHKKLAPNKIIIFGRSLGGAVAVDLASQVNAGALIVESSFSSIRDIVDTAFPILTHIIYLRYSFNSLNKIGRVKMPLLVIHSPDDRVIPYESGIKLFNAAVSEKVFLEIKGGHNDGFMQSITSYMKSLHLFIQSI